MACADPLLLSADTARAYLRRIGLDGPLPPPTLASLRSVVRAHVQTVPFENLSVSLLKTHIPLSQEAAVAKILPGGRGGFCFELNGALAWLLVSLGYRDVSMHTARVWRADSGFGLRNTHMCLTVLCDDDPTPQLVDVGFTAATQGPLPLLPAVPDTDVDGHTYVLRSVPADWACAVLAADNAPGEPHVMRLFERVPIRLGARVPSQHDIALAAAVAPRDAPHEGTLSAQGPSPPRQDEWENLFYEFDTRPVPYATFEYMCNFHQTNSTSTFMRGVVCTQRRPGGGRVTLSSGAWAGEEEDTSSKGEWRLARRDTAHGERRVETVVGHDALARVLRDEFGIALPLGPLVLNLARRPSAEPATGSGPHRRGFLPMARVRQALRARASGSPFEGTAHSTHVFMLLHPFSHLLLKRTHEHSKCQSSHVRNRCESHCTRGLVL